MEEARAHAVRRERVERAQVKGRPGHQAAVGRGHEPRGVHCMRRCRYRMKGTASTMTCVWKRREAQ